MNRCGKTLWILHLVVSLRATSGPYNEHCLPMAGQRLIALCSFFKSSVEPPSGVLLFEGDGTVRGFLRALRAALDDREYDVIHVHAPQAGALLLMISVLKRRSLKNTVYTVQNSFQSYRMRNRLLLYPIFVAFPSIVLCLSLIHI